VVTNAGLDLLHIVVLASGAPLSHSLNEMSWAGKKRCDERQTHEADS
jgi:hypothetical protein